MVMEDIMTIIKATIGKQNRMVSVDWFIISYLTSAQVGFQLANQRDGKWDRQSFRALDWM